MVVDQSPDPAPLGAGNKDIADAQGAALDQHRGHRTATGLDLRLDDHALGEAIGIGLEIEDLGLQEDCFHQPLEIGALLGGNLDGEDIAAQFLDHQVVLQHLGPYPLRIGTGHVDLVDGDDDRHVGRLRVADRLDRLRHNAVIRGNHENHKVGHLGATRAHVGKGGMARRVDEGDARAVLGRNLIGADVLGDPAGLAGYHVRLAQGVEHRRLAVVDMAHHRDDRSPRLQAGRVVRVAVQADFDVGLADPLDFVAVLAGDQFGGVGVDGLGDGCHHAHLH